MACLVAGAVVGWLLVGGALVDDLQVEEPGNVSYEEYLGLRQICRAIGVAVGILPIAVVGIAVVVGHRRRLLQAWLQRG